MDAQHLLGSSFESEVIRETLSIQEKYLRHHKLEVVLTFVKEFPALAHLTTPHHTSL